MANTPTAQSLADGNRAEYELMDADDSNKSDSIPEAEAVEVDSNDKLVEGEPENLERPPFPLKPTLIIIAAAVIGFLIGFALSDGRGSEVTMSWIKLPGDLFIRALKCIVLPLVFVNITLAVVDMLKAGKASSIGWTTIGLYTLTTMLAALEGLTFILIFKSGLHFEDVTVTETIPTVGIKCPGNLGVMGFVNNTGSNAMEIGCFTAAELNGISGQPMTNFTLLNTNNYFLVNEDVDSTTGNVEDSISFSDTLQEGIFRKMVLENLMGGFLDANFIGVIVFAMVFAAASQRLPTPPTVIMDLFEEINKIFMLVIEWIMFFNPIGVASLIAGNLGDQSDIAGVFANIGLLIAATLLAYVFHYFITLTGLFLFFVRENPFKYYRFLIPAQLIAFASGSSAATLPMSLECVKASGEVPDSVRNFVLSMGCTLNMDGGAIYFATTIVYLAMAEGLEERLNAGTYFLIVILCTIGSAGTAPVANSALVMILTAYNTVFDTTGTPEAFGLVWAIDWFVDRFRATLNVTGDTIMARVVTAIAKVPMHEEVI